MDPTESDYDADPSGEEAQWRDVSAAVGCLLVLLGAFCGLPWVWLILMVNRGWLADALGVAGTIGVIGAGVWLLLIGKARTHRATGTTFVLAVGIAATGAAAWVLVIPACSAR